MEYGHIVKSLLSRLDVSESRLGLLLGYGKFSDPGRKIRIFVNGISNPNGNALAALLYLSAIEKAHSALRSGDKILAASILANALPRKETHVQL